MDIELPRTRWKTAPPGAWNSSEDGLVRFAIYNRPVSGPDYPTFHAHRWYTKGETYADEENSFLLPILASIPVNGISNSRKSRKTHPRPSTLDQVTQRFGCTRTNRSPKPRLVHKISPGNLGNRPIARDEWIIKHDRTRSLWLPRERFGWNNGKTWSSSRGRNVSGSSRTTSRFWLPM